MLDARCALVWKDSALSAALELMPHAVEKLRYWLAHPGIYARDLSSERMADVWRVALGQLQVRPLLVLVPKSSH